VREKSRLAFWCVALCVLGLALSYANGRNMVNLLIWVAPGLMLALLRAAPLKQALAGGFLAALLVGAMQWTGVVPLPTWMSAAAASGLGLILFLPFLADRLAYKRLTGLNLFLVFPLAQVALELALSVLSPFGTWGAYAYTQTDFPVMVQIASLGGHWAISFVAAAAAPALAALVSGQTAMRDRVKPLAVFALILAATVSIGAYRLSQAPVDPPLDRVTALAAKPADLALIYSLKPGCDPALCQRARTDARAQTAAMVARTRAAAQAGTDIIVWSEVAAPVFGEDEAALMAELQAIARTSRTMIAPAIWVIRPGVRLWENKVLLIDQSGTVLRSYLKSRPVPGDLDVLGTGKLEVVSTSLGKIGLGICYDMDFQALGRTAQGADIVLVPGSDWAAIDPLHPRMVGMRGVENGYAVVRPSRRSQSIAFDQFGKILGSADYYTQDNPTLDVQVPKGSGGTFYSRTGDWFAYLCLFGFGWLGVIGFRARARQSSLSDELAMKA
jgi:apolipoprotein N-acyltransferase